MAKQIRDVVVAPVMIGVALLIHDAASARYGRAIGYATEQVRSLPDPTGRDPLPERSAADSLSSADADFPVDLHTPVVQGAHS
ncbi:hypothetical protein [Nocardia beijingensis]